MVWFEVSGQRRLLKRHSFAAAREMTRGRPKPEPARPRHARGFGAVGRLFGDPSAGEAASTSGAAKAMPRRRRSGAIVEAGADADAADGDGPGFRRHAGVTAGVEAAWEKFGIGGLTVGTDEKRPDGAAAGAFPTAR